MLGQDHKRAWYPEFGLRRDGGFWNSLPGIRDSENSFQDPGVLEVLL